MVVDEHKRRYQTQLDALHSREKGMRRWCAGLGLRKRLEIFLEDSDMPPLAASLDYTVDNLIGRRGRFSILLEIWWAIIPVHFRVLEQPYLGRPRTNAVRFYGFGSEFYTGGRPKFDGQVLAGASGGLLGLNRSPLSSACEVSASDILLDMPCADSNALMAFDFGRKDAD
ncbi:hypothetical protein BDN72DRAFT_381731 [Pluteus cervinus]|uniref:Uncharacterized protein n=1 Tax=Pluteus cervinus TaxID=181527 RepID=A0ACD3A9W0_9AGAR|nr:hypothetical protein BDN72DRAFT_381731 [Pluteus cervinus]